MRFDDDDFDSSHDEYGFDDRDFGLDPSRDAVDLAFGIGRDVYDTPDEVFARDLRSTDPVVQQFAYRICEWMLALARERAARQGVLVSEVWPQILSTQHLLADVRGSNKRLARLADRILDGLNELAELRESRRDIGGEVAAARARLERAANTRSIVRARGGLRAS